MANTPDNTDTDLPLTDVMLAMDVVDTLRHEESLIATALNAKAREQALVERVRDAYQSQGISVSDEMIAEGVAALKARQYAYEPPAPGLRTRLLHAWVRRRRIGGGLGVLGGLAAIIGLGWYGFVVAPENAEREAQATQLNNEVIVAATEVTTLEQRYRQLTSRLQEVDVTRAPALTRDAVARATQRANDGLNQAIRALESATTLTQPGNLDADNLAERLQPVSSRLAEQQSTLAAARSALNDAEVALDQADAAMSLPATLELLRGEALQIAVPAAADAKIESDYQRGISLLRRGDASAAMGVADELRAMIATLEQTYTVRIVSRPGENSGIIREPPNNRRASNYYLIVEAVGPDNTPVPVEIVSEEDGSSLSVRKWGVRVSEEQFDSVRRDKQDDGIIQQAEIGSKRRGYLQVDYRIAILGGFINRWEAFR